MSGIRSRKQPFRSTVQMTSELAEPVAAVAGLAQLGANGRKSRDVATHGPTEAENVSNGSPEGQNKTPGQLSLAGGFNVTNLAVSLTRSWNSAVWKSVVQQLDGWPDD